MTKRNWKRIALIVLSVFGAGVVVLIVHIYMVSRPPHIDANTRVMARIDVRQDMNAQDAQKISDWLYRQKGVDHVLVNPASHIAVFTFAPMLNSADKIVQDFKADLPYKAERFLPPSRGKGSCPAGY